MASEDMKESLIIERQIKTFHSLVSSVTALLKDAISKEHKEEIISKGYFSPQEDKEIRQWFAKFITIRINLWSVVDTSIENAGSMDDLLNKTDYQYFVLGYAAVCYLIKMDRFLINDIATSTLVQRKLNEADIEYKIDRKQFIKIQQELVRPSNAIRIYQAHNIFKKRNKKILAAVVGSKIEGLYKELPKLEKNINFNRLDYFVAWLKTRRLTWRRRGASAKQKTIFAVLEYSGRIVSEVTLPTDKNVTTKIRNEIQKILEPGDILITRHKRAMTNLFLPGYWPHAALYIGNENKYVDEKNKWNKKFNTFEALKDGVHFRELTETLNVDAFVVIKPNLSDVDIGKAINRITVHAGKAYNFDFDFFGAEKLVCTEVIYRAYDGINDYSIPLKERMGKRNLSAEDILDLALDTDWANVQAIYGVGKSKKEIIYNEEAVNILKKSYRKKSKITVS